jgi:hypothetical protein
MTIYFVKNDFGTGVGFTSEIDARYASTGESDRLFVTELAVHFRRISGAKKWTVYPIEVLVVKADENIQNLNNKSS